MVVSGTKGCKGNGTGSGCPSHPWRDEQMYKYSSILRALGDLRGI